MLFLFIFLFTSGILSNVSAQDVFFTQADDFLKQHVKNGLVDYKAVSQQTEQINRLKELIRNTDLKNSTANYKKAFWINAYNVITIIKLAEHYPTDSPLHLNSFFEQKNNVVAGKKVSLNQLEHEVLFENFDDPRLHFVLVCGAIDCPRLKKGAYFPEGLEEQIKKRTRVILNDPEFIKIDRSKNCIELSEIFRWYNDDFEKGDNLVNFINAYRRINLPEDFKVKYYKYNWAINDIKNTNIQPLQASALLHPGVTEIKVFNSLYTQTTFDGFEQANSRSSFFSSFTQVLYGWNNNINIGFDLVYKSNVTNDLYDASPFKTLGFKSQWDYQLIDCNDHSNISPYSNCAQDGTAHDTLRNAAGDALQTHHSFGLSHFGPKIKFNPIRKWSNLSLQQTLFIPIQKHVDGNTVSFTQLFYDQPIGSNQQIFVEASLWTNIHPDFKPFPFVKAFYSYFPAKKWTVYGMTSNLIEYGGGVKYFILPQLEVELLYTYFLPWEQFMQDRRATTFNFGIRYRG